METASAVETAATAVSAAAMPASVGVGSAGDHEHG
jgi:hypothetical protein